MMTRLFIMQLAHQDNWPLFHKERNEEKPTKDAGRRIEQEKVDDNEEFMPAIRHFFKSPLIKIFELSVFR